MFKLFNNNKHYPVLISFCLIIIGLIVWKLPATDLAKILTLVINNFAAEKGGLIFWLLTTNIGWFYISRRVKKNYEKEIERLSKIRSELMHSNKLLEQGKTPIINHRSSNDECDEQYILPSNGDEEDVKQEKKG